MATKDEKSREKSRHKSKDRDKSTDRGKSKDREKSSDKVKSKDREKSTDKVKSKDRSKDKPLKEEDSPGSNKENKTHRSKSKDKESKDKEKRHKSREKSSDLNNDAKKDRSEKHKSKSKEDTDGKKHREKKEKETESHMNGSAGGVAVIKQPQVPTEQKETAENYGYEDDFEEYDDDFEDDDEGDEEVAKVTVAPPPSSRRPEQQEADNEEEEAKDTVDDGSKMKAKKRKQDSADSRRKSIQSRIDFSHASAPEISFGALGQAQKRHLRLLNLIDLDGMTYDILEMPPVKDYEFYIQNFGKGNRIQVQTQTGDEDVERDIQTDEVDNEGKWTQHPPMDVHGCGGDTATKTYEDAEEDEFRQFRSGALHSAQFLKFTAAAGQLISDLLSEGHMSMDNNKLEHRTSEPFSTGFNTFSLGALAKDAQVTAVAYCQQQPNFFVTALYIKDSLAEDIAGKTLIVQWSIDDMEVPVMLLLCENMVHSCCYSPNGDTAVFAGLDDGSVVAWDLTESDSLHHVTIPWKSHSDLVLRTATYNTAFLNGVKQLSKSDLYTSPIRTVACIGDLTSDKSVSTYQLACLEECGTVHIWTVLETLSTATETTSELDFGLSPGGKLKLLKSAEIKPSAAVRRDGALSLYAHGMVQNPSDHSQFYIGTDYGFILHVARSKGGTTGPRGYQSDFDVPSDVLCQAFSPFEPTILIVITLLVGQSRVFLSPGANFIRLLQLNISGNAELQAGSSDGAIRLYKTSQPAPLLTLRLSSGNSNPDSKLHSKRTVAVARLAWSWTNPFVFYSVHGESELAVWDLKKSRTYPKSVSNCQDKTILALATWGVPAAEAGHMKSSFLAIGFADGNTELHLLKDEDKEKDYSLKSDGYRLVKILGFV